MTARAQIRADMASELVQGHPAHRYAPRSRSLLWGEDWELAAAPGLTAVGPIPQSQGRGQHAPPLHDAGLPFPDIQLPDAEVPPPDDTLVARRNLLTTVGLAAGTMIDTLNGPHPVESLVPGDQVRTLDHGYQPVRWINAATAPGTATFAPVLIRAGALGNPHDLLVSPRHRVMIDGAVHDYVDQDRECLVPVRALVNGATIRVVPRPRVAYFHLLLSRHELIYTGGIPTESFLLDVASWRMLLPAHHEEILQIFPRLAFHRNGRSSFGPSVRRPGKVCKERLNACAPA